MFGVYNGMKKTFEWLMFNMELKIKWKWYKDGEKDNKDDSKDTTYLYRHDGEPYNTRCDGCSV